MIILNTMVRKKNLLRWKFLLNIEKMKSATNIYCWAKQNCHALKLFQKCDIRLYTNKKYEIVHLIHSPADETTAKYSGYITKNIQKESIPH